MYIDPAEVQLRGQLEQALGRSVSDDEWESLKQEAASRAAAATGRRPGIVARGARFLLTGVVNALGPFIFFLIGAVWVVIYNGLGWAYGFGTLEGRASWGVALFGGLCTVLLWVWESTRAWLVLALSGGLVALAIGAIVHVAGG